MRFHTFFKYDRFHCLAVAFLLLVFLGILNIYYAHAPKLGWVKLEKGQGKQTLQEMKSNLDTQTTPEDPVDWNALILRQPSWVQNKSWGLRRTTDFQKPPLTNDAQDHEDEIAWKEFFSGTTNGLVLELGAMDGRSYSISKFFEKVGWKAILIEASPDALRIPRNRPDALSLRLGICNKKSTIHFVFVRGRGIGGILEFMSLQFLKAFHPELLKNGSVSQGNSDSAEDILDWNKVRASPKVTQRTCLPLQAAFDRFQIDHINFMVLDLEGGELAALKSLDFERIQFDVLCVETNRFQNESDPYIDQVVNFMTGKGYKVYMRISGRNSWFVSPTFNSIVSY